MNTQPPWLDAQLRRLLARPGHAWLLHGPSGLGQWQLALQLARAWLCDAPTPAGACGQCASCHAIDVHTHADLAVLMPETMLLEIGWPLSEAAQDKIDKKERKPSAEIRVDAVREAIEFAQRTDARGRGKVLLVHPAERLNAVSANALLKTLEEPPGRLRVLLATDAAHELLPTIRSRCLDHAMSWPPPAQAQAWLTEQGVPAADAPALLRATGGRPLEALAWHAQGRTGAQWAQLPRALAAGHPQALAGWAPAEAVNLLHKLCHDQLARAAGAPPRFFAEADLPPAPPLPQLARWARELAEAARTAEHPFNPGLMAEALVSRARSALHSGRSRS